MIALVGDLCILFGAFVAVGLVLVCVLGIADAWREYKRRAR